MRKIIGFDTFGGLASVDKIDLINGQKDYEKLFACTDGYEKYLDEVMNYQEQDNPMSHVKKYEIVKGDACQTIDEYLERNVETIIALAYFDFDIYKPTKKCLEAIKPHLVKGSMLVFDELNDHDFPGETLAVNEVFGLNTLKMQRYRYHPRPSYCFLD